MEVLSEAGRQTQTQPPMEAIDLGLRAIDGHFKDKQLGGNKTHKNYMAVARDIPPNYETPFGASVLRHDFVKFGSFFQHEVFCQIAKTLSSMLCSLSECIEGTIWRW